MLTGAMLAGSSMALAAPTPPAPPPRIETVRVAPPVVVPVPVIAGCTLSATVPIPDSDWGMCVLKRGDWIYTRNVNFKTGASDSIQPVEHGLLFAMLASTRLELLWPQLIDFVGADGERLRSALRRRAQATLNGAGVRPREGVPLDNFVGGSVLATIQAAEFYSQAGDIKAARTLIAGKRSEVEALGFESEAMQFSWVSLLLRLAKLEVIHGFPENAIALYQQIEANPGIALDIKANGRVNHAALLAETGRGREALAMLEQAEAASGTASYQVTGSNRQFAWIRACALTLLGDRKGAAKAIKVIRAAPQELRGTRGQIASTETIEARMAYCMGDDEALARLSRNPLGYLVDPAALIMQRSRSTVRPGNFATNRRVEQRYARSGYVPAVRQIPAGLVPAMNYWIAPPLQLAPPVKAPASVGAKG